MTKVTNDSWNKIIIIFLILVVAGLLYLLEPILFPFAAGALLAYLCNPLVNRLMDLHMSRLAAVIIVFLALFFVIIGLLFLLIPLIQKQIMALIDQVPTVVTWLQTTLMPNLMAHLNSQPIDGNAIKNLFSQNLTKAGSVLSWLLQTMLNSGKALFEGIINLLLIPVVTFYLMRDWNIVIANTRQLIPRKLQPSIFRFTKEADAVLSAFFRGQLLVMLSLGIIYSVGLTLIGLQVGIVIGLIAGLVSIVPYLGLIVGLTAAVIAALVQFGTLSSIVWVCVVFAIGQTIESMFLTPTLIGDRIGLHPVAVIFAILAGGTLFGFFGVLLALPVASVIMVLLRHVNQHFHSSSLYKA